MLLERLRLAAAPGGVEGTAWWLLQKISGIETHHLFTRKLSDVDAVTSLEGAPYALHCVRSPADELALDPAVRELLEQHFAESLVRLLSSGFEIFFLASSITVISQLIITGASRVVLDSPSGVAMDIGSRRAFLSYLYTYPEQRRIGTAKRLLALVCSELKRRGYRELIAHVRTTNVPSVNTFKKGGWLRIGTIWTRTSSNWLACSSLGRHGITVQPVSEPTRG